MKALAMILAVCTWNLKAEPTLPASSSEIDPPAIVDSEPEGMIAWVIAGAAVVAVAATAIYICAKAAEDAGDRYRCEECGRIIPRGQVRCPTCGTLVPPEHRSPGVKAQFDAPTEIIPPSERPQFQTAIQMDDGEGWEDVVTEFPLGMQMNSQIQIKHFDNEEAVLSWMVEKGAIQLARIPAPDSSAVRFRLIERDL